jgi:hypothetical protein
MKQICILLLCLLFAYNAKSQDLIIQKDGDEIKSRVLEVNLEIIKYKKFDNLNGPTFEISKSDVFIIKYENGTKDVFNVVEKNKKNIQSSDLTFTENHRSFSIAYGISASLAGRTTYGSSYTASYTHLVLPFLLSFDRAISKRTSLAIRPAFIYTEVNYSYQQQNSFGGYNTIYYNEGESLLALQARIDYHWISSNRLDPYFGIGGGVGVFSNGGLGNGGVIPLFCGGFGLRIYGKEKNAFLIELGYDSYSFLKAGYVFGRQK